MHLSLKILSYLLFVLIGIKWLICKTPQNMDHGNMAEEYFNINKILTKSLLRYC